MDAAEKAIFRRKRPLVAKLLQFSIPMQKKYREYGLLTDSMFQDILPEQTDRGQVMRWLELVMRADDIDAPFLAMQRLLSDLDHGWVTDQMRIDLLAEKGELQIEEYVHKEAQMIVHKIFGQSKRISEKDKTDISYILALRYQAAKDALHAELARLAQERDEAQSFKWEENGKLKALSEKIQTFLKIQKLRLNEHVDGSGAHDSLRNDRDPEGKNLDYLALLEENVDGLLETLARVLLERETLSTERKRCLRVLGIPKLNTSLDIAMENALRSAADDIQKSRREVDLTDKVAQDLDTRLKNTQRATDAELAAKDRQIQYLESQLKANKDQCSDLEAELRRLKARLSEAEQSIKVTTRRADALGKTRRLGYYHPGWVEKTYDEYGIDATELNEDQALVPVENKTDDKKKKKEGQNSVVKDGSKPGAKATKLRPQQSSGMKKSKSADSLKLHAVKPGKAK